MVQVVLLHLRFRALKLTIVENLTEQKMEYDMEMGMIQRFRVKLH